MTASTLHSNVATLGGGLFHKPGQLLTVANTFSNNQASIEGGGIHNDGPLNLLNSTFSGSLAGEGAAIFNAGTLAYTNTLITNSGGVSSCHNAASGLISANLHNLVQGQTSCGLPFLSSGANLGLLADNGGPTLT